MKEVIVIGLDKEIEELVNEEYKKMKMSKVYSNNSKLYNIVSHIVYYEWDVYNDNINDLIIKYVDKLIEEE